MLARFQWSFWYVVWCFSVILRISSIFSWQSRWCSPQLLFWRHFRKLRGQVPPLLHYRLKSMLGFRTVFFWNQPQLTLLRLLCPQNPGCQLSRIEPVTIAQPLLFCHYSVYIVFFLPVHIKWLFVYFILVVINFCWSYEVAKRVFNKVVIVDNCSLFSVCIIYSYESTNE